MTTTRVMAGLALAAASALALAGCASGDSGDSGSADGGKQKLSIGISQLVQHPALDAATEGFKKAFIDAGYVDGDTVNFDVQNANGEQSTAVTIAQSFASQDLDMVLAVATPAAQAAAQAITNIPVLFTAVTDAESAELVDSNEKPGGNITGTSDAAPIGDQLDLLQQIVPDAKVVGIVYSSGEVNSEVQVKAAEAAADERGMTIKSQTVTTANDIAQAAAALGDVDAIYVPTDNTVVSGISALVQYAEGKQIPIIGAEAGTVEGGAIATLGIDYEKLGHQTGEMALKILENDGDPATMPVEVSKEFSYVVNPGAAERMGVTIPEDILDKAETVE
ncbi:putative ABC transport system substrate-binding protein [Paramicrobacterium humi]|uniref:Putative ABC transport system substrate-binding protein n=1 Tax=Paramicrobacterium humi TaxID=640635 RepID=A0A1H4IPT7_9MICO|nr:ABC transporter substrate-binding protein [Microbacterium humi]SEB36114.1 putative ABC transport system substrate-binding protein [Microbacterium humi]